MNPHLCINTVVDIRTCTSEKRENEDGEKQQFSALITTEPTCVELHEGGDQLFDRQWVVLHHFRESLSTRLDSRVGDEQHLHQLGNKVGVPDVILAADEHHQKGNDVLDARFV